MIDDNQLTVQLFIDDLHISCVHGKAINKLVCDLNNKFKTKVNELSICKAIFYNYSEINIDYTSENYMKFTMCNFIEDVPKETREDINGMFSWPANS